MTNPSDLVCDFVNTYDVECGIDTMPSPAALAAWLHKRDLIGPDDTARDEDLAVAVGLRETLRAALRHNHDHEPESAPHVSRASPAGRPDGRRAGSRARRGRGSRRAGEDRGRRDGRARGRDVAEAEGLHGEHLPVGVHRLVEESFALVVFDEGLRQPHQDKGISGTTPSRDRLTSSVSRIPRYGVRACLTDPPA